MAVNKPLPLRGLDEEAALRTLLQGTATETGERFFAALVQNLAKALSTHGAWVTEYLPESRRLRALAFWMDGKWVSDYETDIDGTPCEKVIETAQLVHIPDNIVALYPDDPELEETGAVSYMGHPLTDVDGRVLGHLAVVDRRPMPEEPRVLALFQIFAARAAAELRRLRAESEVREREEKLGQLVDSAMDAIIELGRDLQVTRVNTAAEKIFGCDGCRVVGQDFARFLTEESGKKLRALITQLDAHPEGERYLWIPGGLTALRADGREFPAEATLSRFEVRRETFHTLILRNVNERLEAERKIHSLTVETQYLKEEINALQNFGEIVGQSKSLRDVLYEVQQVADTNATVLILGETGTGKELVARAIHAASQRHDGPLIKVNCAAIPEMLIESEFFGHEKGSFTGATMKREGRFALADDGTVFLDEVGELPIDLQVKLLRVLQEGEFEPVGSSQTRKVDVRVIAATNRDLQRAVQEGAFREDLYYRLNVFPIRVPPLRDRGDDIGLLATTFTARFAQKMGRAITAPSPEALQRLKGYDWPGNVRELQNVIERAVITSRNGQLNLDRALPETTRVGASDPSPATRELPQEICTAKDLEARERTNLIRALEATGWRVAGDKGAAQLLGMNSSTLNSRMKALGIKRPRQN